MYERKKAFHEVMSCTGNSLKLRHKTESGMILSYRRKNHILKIKFSWSGRKVYEDDTRSLTKKTAGSVRRQKTCNRFFIFKKTELQVIVKGINLGYLTQI